MARKGRPMVVGDRVRIRGIVHEVVSNFWSRNKVRNWVNVLGTRCGSHRLNCNDKRRVDLPTTCFACLMEESDDARRPR